MLQDLAIPVKQHFCGQVDHEPGVLQNLWDGDALLWKGVENAPDEVLAR